MKKIFTITIISAISYLLFGCASVVTGLNEGNSNRKTITRIPRDVTVIQDAYPRMIAPYEPSYEPWKTIVINRGNGPFRGNVVELWKAGRLVGVIRPRINPWIFGNIIYGGIPGFLVDGISGAMWEHDVFYLDK